MCVEDASPQGRAEEGEEGGEGKERQEESEDPAVCAARDDFNAKAHRNRIRVVRVKAPVLDSAAKGSRGKTSMTGLGLFLRESIGQSRSIA